MDSRARATQPEQAPTPACLRAGVRALNPSLVVEWAPSDSLLLTVATALCTSGAEKASPKRLFCLGAGKAKVPMGEQLHWGSSGWARAGAATRRGQNAHPRTQNRMERHGRALFRVCLLPVFGPRVRGSTPRRSYKSLGTAQIWKLLNPAALTT